jgi:predicted DNA-binding transcriptional regulator YafY
MRPEEKLELLKLALEHGLEVRTLYRDRRVVSVDMPSERYVAIRYEDGGVDKMHMSDFGRRRFVILL